MSNEAPDDWPIDPNEGKSRAHLECIGSFKAFTQDGETYTIEIWTHFAAVHDRERARVTPTQLVLRTSTGDGVDRIDQGEYRLRDSPEVTFSTDDPNAP